MVTNRFQSLTVSQQQEIVQIVRERIGKNSDFQQFSMACVEVIDALSGFETIKQSRLNLLITKLWRIYRA